MSNLRLLVIALVVSADAGIQAGHSSWVLNGCKKVMRNFVGEHWYTQVNDHKLDLIWSAFVTLRIVGQLLGAELARPIVDRYGRRFCLRLNAVNFVLSNLLQFLAGRFGSVMFLFLGRIMQCAGVGVAQISLSIFITEISPNEVRGRNASFYNVFIGLGSVVTIILANQGIFGNSENWPFIMLFPMVTSIVHFLLSLALPESPKYLISARNRLESGEKSLEFYRNNHDKTAMADIVSSLQAEKLRGSEGTPSIKKLLQNRYLRSSISIMLVVSTARALSGYHVMFSYSTFAIEQAGMPEIYAQWATVGVATLRFVFSLPLSWLVERIGRRPLMIGTSWGTLCCFVLLLISTISAPKIGETDDPENLVIPWSAYLGLLAEMMWPLTYNFGIGPIPRFIVAEIFPQADRALAQKISVQWDCAVSFIFTFLYLPWFRFIGGWVYLVIIIPLVPLSVYMTLFMPETKNKDISTILDEIYNKSSGSVAEKLRLVDSESDSGTEDVFCEKEI